MGCTPINPIKATRITKGQTEMTLTHRKTQTRKPKPQVQATRHLPVQTLELFALTAGAGCVDFGEWDGLAEGAVVFANLARQAGGCDSCPTINGPCPQDALTASLMLRDMLGLLGINAKFDAGYGSEIGRVARWLDRDIRSFGPKPPRPTRKAHSGTNPKR